LRRPFLQLLHQAAGALRRLGLDQEVKVFRHQNPAVEQKARFLPKLPLSFNELTPEAMTFEELQATIDT
jgi:hypothetical protein